MTPIEIPEYFGLFSVTRSPAIFAQYRYQTILQFAADHFSEASDLGGKTGIPLFGCADSITMDTQFSDYIGVAGGGPSEIPDLPGDPDIKSGIPLIGSGEPISVDMHSSHKQTDENSALSLGWDVLFVSGDHQVFATFNSVFSNIWEGVATDVPGSEMAVLRDFFPKAGFCLVCRCCDIVASGGDYVKRIPGDRWLATCWKKWEPEKTLYRIDVLTDCALFRCVTRGK